MRIPVLKNLSVHYFTYKSGPKGKELFAEDVSLSGLARAYGTPLYVYSRKTIQRHIRAYSEAFSGIPHIICFALKANANGAILKLLAESGTGADIVSGGELYRSLKAGIPASKTVYAGVGKTAEEIEFALKKRILMFNVESGAELALINRIAGALGVKAPIALRVNPDIDPKSHPYIATGLREHKFGIPIGEALMFYRAASRMRNIAIVGIHKHIGSQLTETAPFVESIKRVLRLVDRLSGDGIRLKYMDIGGGLGIPYKEGENPPPPQELASRVVPLFKGRDFTLIIEPGRSIVGNAGVLLTKCLYVKKSAGKEFLIVDAGMNDLIRPALYGAYHEILPVRESPGKKTVADVVGPICESSDFLALGRLMPPVRQGGLLSVMGAGAYGFSMGSGYNSRLRPAEVMVDGRRHFLIREREDYADLLRNERPARLEK